MNIFERNVLRLRDRYLLHRYIYPFVRKNKNREISFRGNICLFSFPRSGSTWLTEILLTIPNSCLFDEPLQRNIISNPNDLPHPDRRKIKEVSDNNFYFFQPIPKEATEPKIKDMFDNLLSGRSISIGLYDDYGLEKLNNAEVYLTKFTHACLMSSWLINQFNFAAIFLIRNPYACISSILRHVIGKKLELPNQIRFPEFKYNKLFTDHKDLYSKFKTTEEFYTFLWCLNFIEGSKKNRREKVSIIFYEELLTDYHVTINKIFKYLNKSVPDKAFLQQFEPSRSAEKYSEAHIKNHKQLNAWKDVLSQNQIKKIRYILNYFEINEYRDLTYPNF